MASQVELPKAIVASILKHAKVEAPNECCGIIVFDGGKCRYVKSENVSHSPTSSFMLDQSVVDAHKGNISYVVHSHVTSSCEPTDIDKAQSELCKIPFVIVSLVSELISIYEPNGFELPYEDRQFVYALSDCRTLATDYYRREFGISVMDDPLRPATLWGDGSDYSIEKTLLERGFKRVSGDLQHGDLLLMNLQSSVVNHIAVYLGGGIILHHLLDRPSASEVYSGYWRKNTECVMRHTEVANVR